MLDIKLIKTSAELTLGASHRSGGCSQRQFCLFLSCRRGRLSPRSFSWSPAVEGCNYYQRHIESLDRIIFYTEPRSSCFQLQASISMFCVVFLPPPRCPGLWRSPFLSESAPSKQTWAEKRDRHTVVTVDTGSNQVNNESRRSNVILTSVPS